MNRTLLVCLAVGLWAPATAGQDAAAPHGKQEAAAAKPEMPVIRENVRQVLVPVVVTDKKGHHVPGLRVSDFHVSEDGIPQEIVAFAMAGESPASGKSAPAATQKSGLTGPPQAVAGASTAPHRLYLICVDTLHSGPGSFSRIRDVLARFFEREQDSGAQYALLALGQLPTLAQDFTGDPSLILAALRSQSFQATVLNSESANLASEVNQFSGLMQRYCEACPCANGRSGARSANGKSPSDYQGTASTPCAPVKAAVQSFLASSAGRTSVLTQNFLHTLGRLVEAMAQPGAYAGRTVVLISDGFNSTPGMELYGVLRAYGPKDQSFLLNPNNSEDRLQLVLRAAVRNNVRFYTLDSRGLYTQASAPGSAMSAATGSPPVLGSRQPNAVAQMSLNRESVSLAWQNGAAMSQLAQATGGLFFENSNDLLQGIRRAFNDGREYYVLAYAPRNKVMDGQYRAIAVEVKDKKLRVQAKAGYWATEN